MADEADLSEDDLALAGGTTLTRVAGAFIALAGGVTGFVAVQVLTSVRILTWVKWLPIGMIALGLVSFVVGAGVLKARDVAASVGVVIVPIMAIVDMVWLYISFSGGFFSLMALFSVPFSLAATLLVIVSLRDCERSSDARRNLAKSGVDLGI